MPSSRIADVRIAGVASAVPSARRLISDEAARFGEEEVARISESCGVRAAHFAECGACASDLCYSAADRLLNDLGWDRSSVEGLIFVSQTPDYVLPGTSCSLQHRLGLPSTCAAIDSNLGCSGYVYGLWLASLMTAGGVDRVLLLAGDTITRVTAPEDRSVALLFGDAGTATAIEKAPGAPPIYFELGTDGGGLEHLYIPAGGFRNPRTAQNGARARQDDGNIRSDQDLYMNGSEIFLFTLARVPPLIRAVLRQSSWSGEDVDAFVFHQANQFILRHLGKRMKIPNDKIVLGLEEFGNTSSASIPLAISSRMRDQLQKEQRLVLAGFGTGYSWAAAALTCGPLCLPEVLYCPGAGDPIEGPDDSK
jgi:3-oxoacyl-[acyl-carrier-protein] synthase-3